MFQRNADSGWHLFDIGGHPTYLNPLFLALIALFAFLGVSARTATILTLVENVLIWVPTLFIGIYLHELGHATALKRFDYGTSKIVLHGFGGVTINTRRKSAPPGKSIVISLAGPAVSFLTAVAAFGGYYLLGATVSVGSGIGGSVLEFFLRLLYVMGLINAVWGVFNMLPINPLDGGHVVLHALRGTFGNRRKAMYYTAIVSLVTLGVVALLTLAFPSVIDPLFAVVLGAIFGVMNYRTLQQSKTRGGGPPNPYGRR
jgi:Zn-dependent protease